LNMRIGSVLTILKVAVNSLVILLALFLGDTFQRLMSINYHAEYTFEIPIGSEMSNIGTFCLVTILLLIAYWGIFTSILPEFKENEVTQVKKLRIIVFLIIIVLLIGIVIVGNYFVQRIDRWSF
jgi:hypothetical protein